MSHSFSIFPLEKLSSHVEITSGFTFKSEQFVDDSTQIPLVKGENVQQGYIDWGVSKYWRADDYNNLEKYHLVTGDIVLAMDRPWVTAGLKWAHIKKHDPKSLLVQRVARLRAKNKLNQDYLRFLISSNYFSGYVQPIVTGVNIPHISGKQIGDFKIPLPSLESQKKIAAILSAYDDLIENNKRRIALLENMAEEIYREWFVRFRFPNYKNAEFEKGIPKGWEVVELKEIAIESSKSTKAGEHLAHRLYLPLDNMGSKQFLPLDHYPYTDAQSSLVTFERGEFIFGAMRPYQHKVVIAPFDGITRTTCFVIKPAQDYLYSYLYLTLFKKSTIDHAMLISNGSDRPYTVWSRGMENMGVIRPDDCTLKSFEKIARPILDSVVSYYFLQRKLEETKNTLLPRLISGKLTVENLNIQFPPSMEM